MKYFVAEVQHDEKGELLYAKTILRVHTSAGDGEKGHIAFHTEQGTDQTRVTGTLISSGTESDNIRSSHQFFTVGFSCTVTSCNGAGHTHQTADRTRLLPQSTALNSDINFQGRKNKWQ